MTDAKEMTKLDQKSTADDLDLVEIVGREASDAYDEYARLASYSVLLKVAGKSRMGETDSYYRDVTFKIGF